MLLLTPVFQIAAHIYWRQLTKIMVFLNQCCTNKPSLHRLIFHFVFFLIKLVKHNLFANKMHLTELVKAPWQQFLLHSNQLWPTIYTMWNFNKMLKNKNTGHCEQIFFQYNLKIICKKKFYLEKR